MGYSRLTADKLLLVRTRVRELSPLGLKPSQISKTLAREGLTRPDGRRFSSQQVGTYIKSNEQNLPVFGVTPLPESSADSVGFTKPRTRAKVLKANPTGKDAITLRLARELLATNLSAEAKSGILLCLLSG